MIDLRLIGAIEVHSDRPSGVSGVVIQPKRLALLTYLTLAEPRGLHSRDRLLALFWPEADEESARHALRNGLHGLRQALGDEVIVTRGAGYVGIDAGALRCDALELRGHLAAGRVDEALALWTGDLAPGFHVSGAPDFERWLEEQRRELRRAVQEAARRRAGELEGARPLEVEALRRVLRLDPGDEVTARRLMQVLAAAGDRAGALDVYRQLAEDLARDVETTPAAATQALALELRSGDAIGLPEPAADFATHESRSASPREPVQPAIPRSSNPALSVMRTPQAGRRVARAALAAGVAVVALAGAFLARRPERVSTSQTEAERAVLRLPARYRADTAAYSSYLRGLTLRFQFRFLASRDTLAALVDRRPLYVPALYGLAHAYIFTTLNDLTDPEDSWPKIDALARRALALDSTAASAWLALASADMFQHLDLARAGERIARARVLDSLDPDVAGMRSVWFRFHGRMDSAVAYAQLARRLDPLSLLFGRLVGKQLYFARRYEESRQVFARMLNDDPGWTRGYPDFAELYRAMGRPREALEWYRRASAAAGDSAGAAALTAVSTDSAAVRVLHAHWRRAIARFDRATAAGERVPPSHYATTYAVLGDTLLTLHWLDSMIARHDSYMHQIRVDPRFDLVRGDTRYEDWFRRSGLPPPAAAGKLAAGLR